jgi:hypothetical protein
MNPSTDIPLAITLGVDDASDPSIGDGDSSVLPNNNQGTHPDVLTLEDIDARAKEMNKNKISLEDVQFLSRAMPLLGEKNGCVPTLRIVAGKCKIKHCKKIPKKELYDMIKEFVDRKLQIAQMVPPDAEGNGNTGNSGTLEDCVHRLVDTRIIIVNTNAIANTVTVPPPRKV